VIQVFAVSDHGLSYPIEVLSILKGDAMPGPAEMISTRLPDDPLLPRQDDVMLIFSSYVSTNQTQAVYYAQENYQVVPIASDLHFSTLTNALEGKDLRDQVKTILKDGLDNLSIEITNAESEKALLESGLKELNK
jgi:hypothetical protein